MGTFRGKGVALTCTLLVTITASTSACTEDRPEAAGTIGSTPTGSVLGPCAPSDLLACARQSTIAGLVPAGGPTKATGTPIKIGMVNQENTPMASLPELSRTVRSGIAFVNEQLGGVNGHPLELEVCNTKMSAEGSTSCGQQFAQENVPVVLGGIDVFGNAIDTLDANHIPYVGGIPVSDQAAKKANSFQWSGGIWGATVAFADYSVREVKAKSASIVYGEFGPITDAANFGKATLEQAGVKVQLIPHPIIATDLSSPVQVAAASNPDVIFMLEADMGCKASFDSIHLTGVKARVFYVGACAAPTIVNQAGPEKTNGAIFNVEQEIDTAHPDADTALFVSIAAKYDPGFEPIGAGTVTFRSFMNLYAVLRGLGDTITAESITKSLRSQVNTRSFMGHPYTCDGKQFGNLTAMCSPQQVLAELKDGQLTQLGTWIDVGKVYGGT